MLGAGDTYDAIDIKLAEGADLATVQAAIEEILPPRTEVVTGEQVSEEAADDINSIISIFGNGLLAFAFITTFVSAFIINNVFGITISQRLRELALMRAVGASTKQVRRMIVAEALIISVTATVLGILGGLGRRQGHHRLVQRRRRRVPRHHPSSSSRARSSLSVLVGVGITLLSVLVPARRAAKIPPVAAMRPELGFAALGASRRLIAGDRHHGRSAPRCSCRAVPQPRRHDRPDRCWPAAARWRSSSAWRASRPPSPGRSAGMIGSPIQRLFGAPGQLARENALATPGARPARRRR